MTTPNQFQVDPEQIRRHANTVSDAAGGLSAATGNLPGELDGNALGTFVQFITAGLGDALNQTREAIAQASSTMDGLSSALTRTAEDYQRSDDDNAELLLGKDAR